MVLQTLDTIGPQHFFGGIGAARSVSKLNR
jgi:hypothetical protein